MAAITHFYYLPHATTDEEVNNAFTQEFMHVHSEDGSTVLIRKMKYTGDKIDPSGLFMAQFLEDVNQDPQLKQAIEDFLNDV